MTLCANCASDVGYDAEDDVLVTCSRCVQAKCLRLEAGDEARLARIDPDEVRRLRKERGWSQSDLAIALRLTTNQVSAFERGLRLPPKRLADWVEAQ